MEFGEQVFISPEEFTENLGTRLASETMTIDEAATELAIALSGLRCDADLIAADMQTLVDEAGDRQLQVNQPEFTTILRLVTRGIIFREDFDDEPELDTPLDIPRSVSVETAIANATEGVTWIDPAAQLWRNKMTKQDAALLKALIRGLEQGGYPQPQAKDAMREEIEGTLDYLATSTSYAAARLMPIMADIMFKAGLNNLRTSLHWVRRLRTMYQVSRSRG